MLPSAVVIVHKQRKHPEKRRRRFIPWHIQPQHAQRLHIVDADPPASPSGTGLQTHSVPQLNCRGCTL
ncbi:hypothetical protein C8Q76DRAFT_708521 [Earliella scabrosa]|nr:hypothetical protein C8Q76DRAFT_708521 [Earliella scabrosa]